MAQKIKSFEFVHGPGGDTALTEPYQEAAGQSYKAGDLVFLSAGLVTVCGADPAKILGIAQKDATGVTNAVADVLVIRPGDVFLANFISGKAFAAGDAKAFEIVKTAAGNWQIDSAAAANTTRVIVHCPVDRSADGTLSGNDGTGGKPLGAVHCSFLVESGTTVQILQSVTA